MKKIALFSLITVSLLFTGCGEDTEAMKAAAKAKADRASELVEMTANKVADKTARL